jgi:hypothetical protein
MENNDEPYRSGGDLMQGVLSAQDVAGDWQGTLKFGKDEERVVISIAKSANGGWAAAEVTPDDGSNPVLAGSVTFEGSTLKLAFNAIRATYEGKLTESNSSFKGTLTQGSPVPLYLDRATEESSWRRDRTTHKIQFINVDDNVKLEAVPVILRKSPA